MGSCSGETITSSVLMENIHRVNINMKWVNQFSGRSAHNKMHCRVRYSFDFDLYLAQARCAKNMNKIFQNLNMFCALNIHFKCANGKHTEGE